MVAKRRIRTQSPKNPPHIYLRLRHSCHRLSTTRQSLSCVKQRFHKIAIYPIHYLLPFRPLPYTPLYSLNSLNSLPLAWDTTDNHRHSDRDRTPLATPQRAMSLLSSESSARMPFGPFSPVRPLIMANADGTLRTITDTRTGTVHRTPPRYNCISRRRSRRRRLPTQLRPHRQRVRISLHSVS